MHELPTPEQTAKRVVGDLAEALHQIGLVRDQLQEAEEAIRSGSPVDLGFAADALRAAQSSTRAARSQETWMTGVLMAQAGHTNVRIAPYRALVAAALAERVDG